MFPDEDPRQEPGAPLLPAALLIPLLLALLAWSLLMPAHAAEPRARLTIELQLDGTSRWQDGGDDSRTTLKRRYRIVTWLQPVGEPMDVNTKAPDYAQTMMARSNQVQARVAQAQARHGNAAPSSCSSIVSRARRSPACAGVSSDQPSRASSSGISTTVGNSGRVGSVSWSGVMERCSQGC